MTYRYISRKPRAQSSPPQETDRLPPVNHRSKTADPSKSIDESEDTTSDAENTKKALPHIHFASKVKRSNGPHPAKTKYMKDKPDDRGMKRSSSVEGHHQREASSSKSSSGRSPSRSRNSRSNSSERPSKSIDRRGKEHRANSSSTPQAGNDVLVKNKGKHVPAKDNEQERKSSKLESNQKLQKPEGNDSYAEDFDDSGVSDLIVKQLANENVSNAASRSGQKESNSGASTSNEKHPPGAIKDSGAPNQITPKFDKSDPFPPDPSLANSIPLHTEVVSAVPITEIIHALLHSSSEEEASHEAEENRKSSATTFHGSSVNRGPLDQDISETPNKSDNLGSVEPNLVKVNGNIQSECHVPSKSSKYNLHSDGIVESNVDERSGPEQVVTLKSSFQKLNSEDNYRAESAAHNTSEHGDATNSSGNLKSDGMEKVDSQSALNSKLGSRNALEGSLTTGNTKSKNSKENLALVSSPINEQAFVSENAKKSYSIERLGSSMGSKSILNSENHSKSKDHLGSAQNVKTSGSKGNLNLGTHTKSQEHLGSGKKVGIRSSESNGNLEGNKSLSASVKNVGSKGSKENINLKGHGNFSEQSSSNQNAPSGSKPNVNSEDTREYLGSAQNISSKGSKANLNLESRHKSKEHMVSVQNVSAKGSKENLNSEDLRKSRERMGSTQNIASKGSKANLNSEGHGDHLGSAKHEESKSSKENLNSVDLRKSRERIGSAQNVVSKGSKANLNSEGHGDHLGPAKKPESNSSKENLNSGDLRKSKERIGSAQNVVSKGSKADLNLESRHKSKEHMASVQNVAAKGSKENLNSNDLRKSRERMGSGQNVVSKSISKSSKANLISEDHGDHMESTKHKESKSSKGNLDSEDHRKSKERISSAQNLATKGSKANLNSEGNKTILGSATNVASNSSKPHLNSVNQANSREHLGSAQVAPTNGSMENMKSNMISVSKSKENLKKGLGSANNFQGDILEDRSNKNKDIVNVTPDSSKDNTLKEIPNADVLSKIHTKTNLDSEMPATGKGEDSSITHRGSGSDQKGDIAGGQLANSGKQNILPDPLEREMSGIDRNRDDSGDHKLSSKGSTDLKARDNVNVPKNSTQPDLPSAVADIKQHHNVSNQGASNEDSASHDSNGEIQWNSDK
jgi:ribosomal protein S8